LLSGITIGSTYGLVGLGFFIIYNASHVINFAQGEFVMIGGMGTVFMMQAGLPMPVAIIMAILLTIVIGMLLEKLAIEPSRKNASVVTLIIITIGASIFLRGLAQVVWDKDFHTMPAFSGEETIHILGAVIVPQNLWVLGGGGVIVLAIMYFFGRTALGKAMLATAYNPLAAQLVGINIRTTLLWSFGLSGLLGAIAGILVAPITFTSYDIGIMLGLKGFCAVILGGFSHGWAAIVGGIIVGVAESLGAGYISSEYKDAIAFIIILLVLFFMPDGLFGRRGTDRV
ncbi:MAG: branched-chain amino acid ABC transporter permease, partial [Rhodospirillales bacterium]|nr:branched-chain amino acid ABC transporter permease [Rhodospirillales bacterium]